jgi:hypothetical protein
VILVERYEKGTIDIKDFKKEPKEKMSKSLKDGLMQYYCDDTSQYIPAKQSITSCLFCL